MLYAWPCAYLEAVEIRSGATVSKLHRGPASTILQGHEIRPSLRESSCLAMSQGRVLLKGTVAHGAHGIACRPHAAQAVAMQAC